MGHTIQKTLTINCRFLIWKLEIIYYVYQMPLTPLFLTQINMVEFHLPGHPYFPNQGNECWIEPEDDLVVLIEEDFEEDFSEDS